MNTTQLSEAKRSLLEKYLHGNTATISVTSASMMRRSGADSAPLSPTQEGIWQNAQRRGVPPFYNESITIHRHGQIDLAVLERCMVEILRRHEAWRTTFEVQDGRPVQVVHRAPDSFPIPLVDVRHLPETERENAALALATSDVLRPFDLEQGPLVRPTLVRLGEEEYRFYLAVHQIIIDGVTAYHIFLPELVALYEAFSQGKPSPLPELTLQCADVADWQCHWLKGEVFDTQLAYWRKHLSGELPVLKWPNDGPRPAKQTFRGTFHPFRLPQELSEQLNEFSQNEGVTLFVVLLTCYYALLHHYTGQNDIIVGTVSPSGRKRAEAQPLLGYFLNPVPLRVDLSNDPTVRELLRRVRRTTVGALSCDDLPFEKMVDILRPSTDPGRNPFFDVAASLEPAMPEVDPSWSLTPMDIASGGGRWDMYLVWDYRPDGIIGRVQYNPDVLRTETVTTMLKHQEILLRQIVSDPNQQLSDLISNVEGPAQGSGGKNYE